MVTPPTSPFTAPAPYFQPALSAAALAGSVQAGAGLANDRAGQSVTGADDIDQCIRVILTTPKGACPHRPLFGSSLHLYIDHPIGTARPHIVREVVQALRDWEPRIRVVRVRVSLDGDAALLCAVEWRYTEDAAGQLYATNLALGQLGQPGAPA